MNIAKVRLLLLAIYSVYYLQRQRRSTIDENCCCSCWDEVKLPAAFLVFLVL